MMFIGLRYLKEPQDLHNVPFGAAASMYGTFRGSDYYSEVSNKSYWNFLYGLANDIGSN